MKRRIICILLALSLCLGLLPVQILATEAAGDGSGTGAPTDLSSAVVTISGSLTYSGGQPVNPAPVVTLYDKVLTLDTDYALAYTAASGNPAFDSGLPVDTGTYQVTVTGIGSYTGSVIQEFTILPGTVSSQPTVNTVTQAVALKHVTFTYPTGWPSSMVSAWDEADDTQLVQGQSYKVTFRDPKGNYTPCTIDVIPWPAPSDTTPPALSISQITHNSGKFSIHVQADELLSQIEHSVNGAAAESIPLNAQEYSIEIPATQ